MFKYLIIPEKLLGVRINIYQMGVIRSRKTKFITTKLQQRKSESQNNDSADYKTCSAFAYKFNKAFNFRENYLQ